MLGLLHQPKVQSADEAVVTLCDRLDNSPLFEDRSAAVLALRGLAHDNRELVASIGLKGLLNTLVRDSFDANAAKATLETLLMLFSTDARRRVRHKRFLSPLRRAQAESPAAQAASDISLWLTDRLLHNNEALQTVLELAATKSDPFTAVYALQLVSVMTVNRPQETKRVLLEAGGVAPLVAALGSAQDMVRDEALLLVSALAADHLEMQKLVAFEGGFDLALQLLLEHGGVVFGGRFGEDAIGLVCNLLEYNTSNQKLFAHTDNLGQWNSLLQLIVDALDEEKAPFLFAKEQVIVNVDTTLQIARLLCRSGAEQTQANQDAVAASGALTFILQIAFSAASPPAIRTSALLAAAAVVNGNPTHQNALLDTDVPYYDFSAASQTPPIMPVASALMSWCVSLSSKNLFDLRCAAMVCLRSAMEENLPARKAFVNDQITAYKNGTLSFIGVLAEYSDENRLNPFRVWFASAIVMHLFDGTPEIKEILRDVKIGDESLGMDVQPLVPALAGELQGALQETTNSSQGLQEPAVVLGYLQLLSVWLYDDTMAVSDFLSESSTVHSLLAQHQTANPLVASLSVVLLGVAYAFCPTSAPLSRVQFHELLTSLGRDQYKLSIRRFRASPHFVNYEELDMFDAPKDDTGFPAVYLDSTFVALMREGLGHISRLIDRDPRVEPASKITFEMMDTANQAIFDKSQQLEKIEGELSQVTEAKAELEKQLQDQISKSKEDSSAVSSGKAKLEQTQKELEEVRTQKTSLEEQLTSAKQSLAELQTKSEKLEADHSKLNGDFAATKAAKEKAENGINKMTRDLFQLQRDKDSLEKENKKVSGDLNKIKPKFEAVMKSEASLKSQLKELQNQHNTVQKSSKELKDKYDMLVSKLRETANILTEREHEEEELREELSALKISAEEQENEFRSLKNREGSNRKKLEAKESELTKAKSDLESAAKELKELKAKLENINANKGIETELSKVKEELDSKTKANTQLESELAKVQTELESVSSSKSKLDKFKIDYENTNSELKKVRKELDSKDQSIQKLETVLDKTKADLEASKKAKADLKTTSNKQETSEHEDLKKENSRLKAELGTNDKLKEVNAKLMKELAVLKAPNSKLEAELKEKQNDLDELMVLLEDLSEKKSGYKARLRAMDGESVSDSEDDDDDDDDEE